MMKLATTTAVAAFLLAGPAFSQTATTGGSSSSAPAMTGSVTYIQQQTEGQWLASSVMGETVRSPTDENIGEINNLVVDKDGRVTAAVIGVGGFLGIGEKDVAVPFNALQLSNERDGDITLAASKDDLRNAPEFKDLDDQDDDKAAQTGMPASTPPATGSSSTAPATAPAAQ